jgi:hypothetical protein
LANLQSLVQLKRKSPKVQTNQNFDYSGVAQSPRMPQEGS